MLPRVLAIATVFALGLMAGAAIAPEMAGRTAGSDPTSRHVSPTTVRGAYGAELLRVIDGDTFEARVRLWPGLDVTTKVRLRGIDAPEIHGRCAAEREKAERARMTLAAILAEGEMTVSHVALDKYGGRVLAQVATPHTADVSQAMLTRGAVRAYAGGRRQGWCG
jgi:endonuclease YncB( thermonuclease family)